MKKKIFVAGMHQESNSFTALMSEKKDFDVYWEGEELLQRMAGVKELEAAGYEIVPGLYADALPGGILKLDDFREMAEAMLAKLPADGSVDGVFFPSHGALEVEFIGSGDAFLISQIRERVGADVPIAVALDLHANNTYTLCRLANIVYGYRTAPHIDIEETRIKTAKMLIRALEEGEKPWTEIVRLPFMMPGENMMTSSGIGKEMIDRLCEIESAEGVWCASFFAGMPWVDCAQGGVSIVLSGIGDKKNGLEAAKKLGQEIWERREEFAFQGVSMEPKEALLALDQGGIYPAILSDSADNITAGATGDNAYMLKMILESGVKDVLYAAMVDRPAVEKLSGLEAGSITDVSLGRTMDEKSEMVMIQGAVVRETFVGEDGPEAAVLEKEGVTVLVFAKRLPVPSEEVLEKYHLKLSDYRILVVKQGYLTPALERAAKNYIMALTPGNCAQKLTLLDYRRVRRPMEPLEHVADKRRILESYE